MDKRLLLTSMFALLASACGGGGGGADSSAASGSSNISGMVNKGIVVNADVTLCSSFNSNGCIENSGFVGAGITDANGNYSIDGAPQNIPLYVVVSKRDNSTLMTCDIELCTSANSPMPIAHADVAFGSTFPVKDGWQLTSVIPSVSESSSSLNVTAVTDIAAKTSLSLAQGHEVVSTQMIANAEKAVRSAFGLNTAKSLSEIPVVDITDTSSINGDTVDQVTLAMSILSASLMSSDSFDASSIVEFTNSGKLTVKPAKVQEIQNKAKALVASDKTDAALARSNTVFEHVPPEQVDLDSSEEVVKAKNFVKKVRRFYDSVRLKESDLREGTHAFTKDAEKILSLNKSNVQAVLRDIERAARAILLYQLDSNSDLSGFNVEKIEEGDALKFTATKTSSLQDGEVITTEVVAKITNDLNGNGNPDCFGSGESCNLDLSGSEVIELTSVKSSIKELNETSVIDLVGTGASTIEDFLFREEEQPIQNGMSSTGLLSIGEISLELSDTEMTIHARNNEGELKFDGNLSLTMSDLRIDVDDEQLNVNSQFSSNNTIVSTFETMFIEVDGKFSNVNDYSDFEFKLSVENPRGVSLSVNEKIDYLAYEKVEVDTVSFETENKFFNVTAELELSTDAIKAANENDFASVYLKIERRLFDSVTITSTVKYLDEEIMAKTSIPTDSSIRESSSVELFDNSGVRVLLERAEDSTISGKLESNNTQVGTISEPNGIPIIRYTDGFFESVL